MKFLQGVLKFMRDLALWVLGSVALIIAGIVVAIFGAVVEMHWVIGVGVFLAALGVFRLQADYFA